MSTPKGNRKQVVSYFSFLYISGRTPSFIFSNTNYIYLIKLRHTNEMGDANYLWTAEKIKMSKSRSFFGGIEKGRGKKTDRNSVIIAISKFILDGQPFQSRDYRQ